MVRYIPRSFGSTIIIASTTIASRTTTEQNDVVEATQIRSIQTVLESLDTIETIRAIPAALTIVSEVNAVIESIALRSNLTILENIAITSVLNLLNKTGFVENIAVDETTTVVSLSPIPIDTTAQMLYDTLQQQYSRLRISSTNSHIAVLALVYFPPAQILSEHSIPGELDVLLIGETYSQIHILKTIDDVTAFIAANP